MSTHKYIMILFILSMFFISCANPYVRKEFTAEELSSISEMEQDLKAYPDDDSTYQILGVLYDRKNHINKSLRCLEKAVEINPDNYEALAYLGMLKTKKGRELSGWYCFGVNKINAVKSGVKDLNRAVHSAPENPGIRLYRIGTLISLEGKFSDFNVADHDLNILEKNIKTAKGKYPDSIIGHALFFRGKYIITEMEMRGIEDNENKKKAIELIKKSLDYFANESPRRSEAIDYLDRILKNQHTVERG